VNLLHIVHGAPGGLGRLEELLTAVWARDDGIDVTTIRRLSSRDASRGWASVRAGMVGKSRWSFAILATFLRRHFHVVILNHVHFVPLAIAFRLLKPRTRVVLIAVGTEVWTRPGPVRRLGLRFVYQVWSISQYTADQLSVAASMPREKIVAIPLALLPAQEKALLRLAPGADDRVDVLTVSRLWSHSSKGVDHLIRSLATLDETQLVVVGDGDDRSRLESVAQELGVRSRVTFRGTIDDDAVLDLYRRCRVFALPSSQEGFGLVFLEAMFAGKPVVAARAGATPEIVRDGATGFLVPYGDVNALVESLRNLLESPPRAREMGRRGREVALGEFSFERYARQVTALLSSLTITPSTARAGDLEASPE